MVNQIELGAADQHGKAITNFKKLMPPSDSDMAEQALKGEYDLGFLSATERTKENKLRSMLVDKVARFLVELGAGFSYVGKALPISVGGDEFELDLLFYHVVLHRYVVIELKTGKFHPKDHGTTSSRNMHCLICGVRLACRHTSSACLRPNSFRRNFKSSLSIPEIRIDVLAAVG